MLVFDEVMTGFRVAYGGAQALYGITPDLTALGKIIGGGLPAAAYGASATIMDQVSPVGPIYQAGTLSGNPLAMAAGLTTLRLLRDEPPYERLETLSARLAEGLDRAATDAGIPHVVQRVGSMLTLFFHDGPVHNYDDAKRERHPALRPLLLGDARPRRLSAVQPVRGRLRLGRAHRGRHRSDHRRPPVKHSRSARADASSNDPLPAPFRSLTIYSGSRRSRVRSASRPSRRALSRLAARGGCRHGRQPR